MAEQPRYTLAGNIMSSLTMQWKTKRSTLVFCALATVMAVVTPFLGILMPKLVIDEIANGSAPERFIAVVGGASLLLALFHFLKGYSDQISEHSVGTIASYDSAHRNLRRYMTIDYELLESPEFKKIIDKASRASQSNHTPAHNIPRTLTRLISNVFGLILYGGVIISINPLIALLLVLSAGINWLFLSAARRYEKNTREARSKLFGKVWYLCTAAGERTLAKDARLYPILGWLRSSFGSHERTLIAAESEVRSRNMRTELADAALILLRDGAAYAYLVWLLLNGGIGLGDFTLIFAAIGAFAGWVSGVILQSSELMRASSEMGDIRDLYEYPPIGNLGPGSALPEPGSPPPAISFRNVTYRYPETETAAIRDINLEIKSGERIAVVGPNGAGKTTLIKLLCGLYRPTEGAVELNGVPSSEYNRDEYFTLFSVVFQDIHLLTSDIAGNIAQQPADSADPAKIERCLMLAGLYDKVQALPDGVGTPLVREVNDEAIELSGGEMQKLALARALYKDAPVIVLDEPTAALDPIAECEIYQKYAELTAGKTSIYISHRLASTRFCDRIIYIDDHIIAETGTHDELMRLGGGYAKMFEIQAQYYKKNAEFTWNSDETVRSAAGREA